MTLDQLEQSLAREEIAPVYLVYGEESFLLEESVRAIVNGALEEGTRAFNLDTLYGGSTSVQEVIAHASAFPMMGSRRVTVVRQFERLFPMRQEERERRVQLLLPYLEHPLDSTALVLVTEKADFRANPFRFLKQHAALVECRPLWDNQVPGWIADRIRKRGGTASPEAVQLLHEYAGSSLGVLDNELEKLFTYLGGRREITSEDVAAVAGASRGYTIFQLQDAIGRKDVGRALRILEAMLLEGQSEQMMITMLTRFNNQLWKLTELRSRGASDAEIIAELGIPGRFVGEYRIYGANFTLAQVEANFRALLEADTALKTSSPDPRAVMDLLLYSLIKGPHAMTLSEV